jgi:hypothetical protein
MREQARPPTTQTCYVSLEYLSVEQPIALHAVEVLPLADSRIPDIEALKLQADRLDSIAAVAVTGTHLVKMANRARALIGHELRLLQVGLRTSTGAADSQLRFRVGTTYMFDSGAHGWNRAPGASDVLPLNQHLLDLAQEHAVWKLPATAGNDLERRVQVALDWLDRARFVVEPVVQLLYLFFALEALLGDTAEGLKADSLAFRQMTLNAIMTDSFDHPAVTWGLYAGARSAAVHGEELTELDARTVEQFGASVRETLGHYLTLAGQHGLTKRSRLLETLRQCPERQELANWLLLHGGSGWRPYLASIGLAEAQPGPEPTDGSVGAEGDA